MALFLTEEENPTSPTESRSKQGLLTFLIVGIVILASYPGIIGGVATYLLNPTVDASLNLSMPFSYDLKSYVPQYVGVPGYPTKINLQLEQTRVSLGSAVRFHIEVIQLAPTPANSPYFYIILNSPTNQDYTIFPPQSSWIPSAGFVNAKPGTWGSNVMVGPDLSFPPQTLISGSGPYGKDNALQRSSEVWFQWAISSDPAISKNLLGSWGVYVFAYGDSYPTSPANQTHALGFAYDMVQVVSFIPSSNNIVGDLFLPLVAIASSFVATWFFVYPSIKKKWVELSKLGREYLLPLILLAALLAVGVLAWASQHSGG